MDLRPSGLLDVPFMAGSSDKIGQDWSGSAPHISQAGHISYFGRTGRFSLDRTVRSNPFGRSGRLGMVGWSHSGRCGRSGGSFWISGAR